MKPQLLAADHIRQLIRHYTTTTRQVIPHLDLDKPATFDDPMTGVWIGIPRLVTIAHPPLLDQLERAIGRAPANGDHGGGIPTSKPAARIEALDALTHIDRDSAAYARDLDLPNATMRRRLQAISGKIGGHTDQRVKNWWVSARIATTWDQPPYQPNIPCPEVTCERWGTLRIRLDEYLARCTACGATWDEDLYRGLGDYVRWAGEHLTGARHWRTTADGDPVECTECLGARAQMGARQYDRARAAKTDDKTARDVYATSRR